MPDRVWRTPVLWALAATAAILAIFWGTAESIVRVWQGSKDYTYGYFILPVAAYLIWSHRESLHGKEPRPEPRALMIIAAMGAVWFGGRLTGLQFLSHYALLAMLLAASWSVFGTAVIRSIAFPLGFLVFAVPFGDVFVPALVEFTANAIVIACRLSTVPVAREASYIFIPGGEFQVAETCAGLRFLTASVALGYAFASLNFRSAIRRTLFLAASVVVALLANGLRAYSIVMIGYLTDMRSPLLKNHYVYGWILYAAVIFVFFLVGSRFREDDVHPKPVPAPPGGERKPPASPVRAAVVSLAVVALAAPWAALAARVDQAGARSYHVDLPAPALAGGWEPAASSGLALAPDFRGTDAELNTTYRSGRREIALFIAYYHRTRQGAELGGDRNAVVRSNDPTWKVAGESRRFVLAEPRRFEVSELALVGPDGSKLRVWVWYWVAGRRTPDALMAKLYDAWGEIRGQPSPTAAFVIAAPDAKGQDADSALAEFMRDMLPSIEASVEGARVR